MKNEKYYFIYNINNINNMKQVISFTLDDKLIGELNTHAEKNNINKSKLIGKLIDDYLKKYEIKNDTDKKS